MVQYNLNVNGAMHRVEAQPEEPLLWVLRDQLGLTGAKYACGMAQCGACTVHLDGEPIRACAFPVGAAGDKSITTIEGLSTESPHPLQQAWIEEQVPQCGYCQTGQIMQAAALLTKTPNPSREEIVRHMNGNICRCGTYNRIIKAIERAANEG